MDIFQTLYDNNYKKVLYYLIKISNNKKLAEDITQETFYRTLIYISQKEDAKINLAWLIKVSQRIFIDWLRKNNKYVFEDFNNYYENLNKSTTVDIEQKIHVKNVLSTLQPRDRALILLKDYFGFKYSEIENIMNISIANIKISLHRARKKFKEAYNYEKQT